RAAAGLQRHKPLNLPIRTAAAHQDLMAELQALAQPLVRQGEHLVHPVQIQSGTADQHLLSGTVEYVGHARTLRLARPTPRPGLGETVSRRPAPAAHRAGRRARRRGTILAGPPAARGRVGDFPGGRWTVTWLAMLERRARLRDRAGLARRVRPRCPAEPVVDLAGNDYQIGRAHV